MITHGAERTAAEPVVHPEKTKIRCPRCSGKGYVVCPECKGTGEERNIFWVVLGRCRACAAGMRGFVTCPKCQGCGAVDPGTVQA